MSILVVGSVALDTLKTPFTKGKDVLGGSATYFSTSANFFSPVHLVAVVGKDFPSKHVNFLKEKGIDIKGLKFEKGKTFRWEGEYGWDFSNPKTIATHLNVFANFNPIIPEEYKNDKVVFLANIDPEIQRRVLSQIKNPRVVACDTMNYWIENKRKYLLKLLKSIDIFFLNEGEARELTGESNLIKAAKSIFKLGPQKVVIKKGEHGSLFFSENSIFVAPAFLMESIVDPTGAGDTFAGGFMGYIAGKRVIKDSDIRRAIVYGSVMATFAVEGLSLNKLGSIKKDDIKKRFNEFKKLTYF